MNEIVYELLALLLCGEQQEKRYILDNVKPEYFVGRFACPDRYGLRPGGVDQR